MNLADRIEVVLQDMQKATGREHGTKANLARIAGCSGPVVNHWLNGEQQTMGYEHAERISKALGYRVNWLMSGKGPKKEDEQDGPSAGVELPTLLADAGLVEDPTPLPAQGGNDLFLNYVSRDEMRLISIYREKGKYRQMLDMIIDFNENQA
jgi:hypothetical protein